MYSYMPDPTGSPLFMYSLKHHLDVISSLSDNIQ